MKISQEKQKKLAYVARRYYLENQRQSDIARELGVSRPMVSRMLAEARELGVVEITVHDPETRIATLLERLRLSTSIRGGVLVEDGADEDATNQLLSQGAVELLRQLDSSSAPGVLASAGAISSASWSPGWRSTPSRTAPSPTSAPWWATPTSPPETTSPTRTSA